MRSVYPETWRHSCTRLMNCFDKLFTRIFLKFWIVYFLPRPQVLNCCSAPQPTLDQGVRAGEFLFSCNFSQGYIGVHTNVFHPHLLAKWGGTETGDVIRVELLEELFREFICFFLGDVPFLYRPSQEPRSAPPAPSLKHPYLFKAAYRDIIPDRLLQR